MTAFIGAPAPLNDLFTHITIDPRLSMLEYGAAPAGIDTAPPLGSAPPQIEHPTEPPVNVVTVDPRTQALLFGAAPTGIVTTPPALNVIPAPPAPVVVIAPISADPRFSAASYAAPSPWAALFAHYHRI